MFLEDDEKWIAVARSKNPLIEVHLVRYGTQLTQWKELLKNPKKNLTMQLPDEVKKTKWDVIFVDAPVGAFPTFSRY